jgi:hypothetical protein|eukprot:Transcript_19661.p2 GENE.Transcript_19661~~Transcript_19661.p2  ORF type:complete len:133 (+),score=25.40 Transcript_19661:686-1084(+)
MLRWLVHGNNPSLSSGRPMVDDGDLRRAKELLSHFELVGHTEELPAFIEASRAVLGWPPLTEALTAKNSAPAPNRYPLSAAERAWTAEHTSLDASLVNHFCAARGSHCLHHQKQLVPYPDACMVGLPASKSV